MSMTLHHCHDARSMRALWLLHEIGMRFDLRVHGFGNDLRDQAYLQLSPAGRVPCLIDGDVVLTESGAITQYLCARYAPELGRTPVDDDWAKWLQWLHFSETIAAHIANLTQQHIVIFEDKDRSPLIMKLERRRLEKTLGVVAAALDGSNYLLCDFSAIDTNIGYCLHAGRIFTRIEQYPNLERYFKLLQSRKAFQKSLPPEGCERIYKRDFYEVWDG